MKNSFPLYYCIIAFIICVSCSKDDDDKIQVSSVIGEWELTTWTIDVDIDLNNDSVFSDNLLDEASCVNNEILVFEANGTFSSNMTYNPSVNISLIDTTDTYVFNVECDTEGTIGLAGSFTQNGNLITLLDNTAIISDNQLFIVYENAVEIYNEDFTEVLDTKDLTLIYQRK